MASPSQPPRTCDIDAAFCGDVAPGEPCCTKSENYGWRNATFTVGALTLGLFFIRFIVFNFRESPKFLLIKGRDLEAVNVVHAVGKFNRRTPEEIQLSVEDMRALDAIYAQESLKDGPPVSPTVKKWYNLTHFKILFATKKSIFLVLLIFAIYMLDYWAYVSFLS